MPDNGERNHKTRKRASQACTTCRSRKIRCDVAAIGNPCTNCKLDQVECITTKNKRFRASRHISDPSGGSYGIANVAHTPVTDGVANTGSNQAARPATNVGAHGEPPGERGGDQQAVQKRDGGNSTSLQDRASDSHGYVARCISHPETPRTLSRSMAAGLNPLSTTRTRESPTIPTLPNYIKPLPSTLSPDDLKYISSKDTFVLPPPKLYQSCLAAFVEFGDMQLPVLDLSRFLHDLDSQCGPGKGRVSLLLLHAVMFAGVAFAEIEVVKEAGYPSRMAARTAFYHKCKVLHDLNAEPDRITSIQSVLMLSTWYDNPQDQKDPGYWTGISLTLACSIRLHLEQSDEDLSDHQRSLRRRLWWSSFVRDQIVNFGMARPTRISEYTVLMLTLEDFDLSPDHDEMESVLPELATLASPLHKPALASIFIEKAKLCIIIGHITSTVFVKYNDGAGNTQNRNLEELDHDLAICGKELEDWVNALPEDANYTGSEVDLFSPTDRAFVVIKAMLRLDYLAAVSALYRPRALRAAMVRRPGDGAMGAKAQRLAHEAASETTTIILSLHDRGLTPYFSATAVPVAVGAMVTHLLESRTGDTIQSATAIRKFHRCMEVLRLLATTYNTAVHAVKRLKGAARGLGIHDLEIQHRSGELDMEVADHSANADNCRHSQDDHISSMSYRGASPRRRLDHESGLQSPLGEPEQLLHTSGPGVVQEPGEPYHPLGFDLTEASHADFWPSDSPSQRPSHDLMAADTLAMNDIMGLSSSDDFFRYLDLGVYPEYDTDRDVDMRTVG